MSTGLSDFLSEAAGQRDDTDVAQGVVAVIPEGMLTLFGYVERVEGGLLTLERIKRVNNAKLGHVSMHPFLHHIPLDKIVMARYSDLSEVRPMGGA